MRAWPGTRSAYSPLSFTAPAAVPPRDRGRENKRRVVGRRRRWRSQQFQSGTVLATAAPAWDADGRGGSGGDGAEAAPEMRCGLLFFLSYDFSSFLSFYLFILKHI